MSAEHIIVELTESYLAPNLERLSGLLAQMRGLGLRVAMDDFGTGYSSLSVLKHCPCRHRGKLTGALYRGCAAVLSTTLSYT